MKMLNKTVLLSFILIMMGHAYQLYAAEQIPDSVYDMTLEELLNIDVSVATKSLLSHQEAPAIISVITENEIKHMGARDLIDILRTVPGFDFTHYITTNTEVPGVRGIKNLSKISIMMNGHHLWGDDIFNNPVFDRLPIQTIKKIEIIRGPGSALYGGGAFSGVINIITKQGGDYPPQIALQSGSYHTVQPSAELSFVKNDLKTYIYADYYSTDGYDGTIESDMATITPGFESAAPGRISGDFKSYAFHTNISLNDLYFSGYLNTYDGGNPVSVTKTLTDEDDLERMYSFVELGYKKQLADKGNAVVRAYYDYMDQKDLYELYPEETGALWGFPDNESPFGSPHSKRHVYGAESYGDYEIHPGIQLMAGLSYEHMKWTDVEHYANCNVTGAPLDVNGTIYNPFEYLGGLINISENGNWMSDTSPKRSLTAVYTQGSFDLKQLFNMADGAKSLVLTAGLRYDHYNDVGSSTNPRCGIVYAPTEKLHVKLLYGKAFRAPSFSELYLDNNPSLKGNMEINPEKMTTIEGFIGYNFTKTIQSGITLFNVKSKDLIEINASRYYDNTDRLESRGMEAEIKFVLTGSKYAYMNLTYLDVNDTTNETIVSTGGQRYKQKDFTPGNIPEILGNIGINYDLYEYLMANISLNYIGERDRSGEKMWDGEQLVIKDQRNPVDDVILVNACLTFRRFFKTAELQLSVFNLLDQDHREPDPDGLLENDMPRPGRSFMTKISYSF